MYIQNTLSIPGLPCAIRQAAGLLRWLAWLARPDQAVGVPANEGVLFVSRMTDLSSLGVEMREAEETGERVRRRREDVRHGSQVPGSSTPLNAPVIRRAERCCGLLHGLF